MGPELKAPVSASTLRATLSLLVHRTMVPLKTRTADGSNCDVDPLSPKMAMSNVGMAWVVGGADVVTCFGAAVVVDPPMPRAPRLPMVVGDAVVLVASMAARFASSLTLMLLTPLPTLL